MSRRDTILIAVLINAALLVVLFVTSMDSPGQMTVVQAPQTLTPAPAPELVRLPEVPKVSEKKQAPTAQGGDQIDQVLSRYSDTLVKKKEPAPAPVPEKVVVASPPVNHKVVVAKGDVLEKIARTHGVTVEDIMKLNKLHSTQLHIGQELLMPTKTAPKAAPVVAEGKQHKYYVVKGGENPWIIAMKNNMQVEELLRLNNMDQEKAKKLRPGDKLRIE